MVVIGSTEEGAVDDLEAILKLRSCFQKKGLSEIICLVRPLTGQAGLPFAVHVDSAWGGYFTSLLSRPESRDIGTAPSARLRPNVENSLRCMRYADSIAIDPHKSVSRFFLPWPSPIPSPRWLHRASRELVPQYRVGRGRGRVASGLLRATLDGEEN